MLSIPVGCGWEGEEESTYAVQVSVNSSKIPTSKGDMASTLVPTGMLGILASHEQLPSSSGSGALS